MACRILVPDQSSNPCTPAVEAQSLNHWTAREVPGVPYSIWEILGFSQPLPFKLI